MTEESKTPETDETPETDTPEASDVEAQEAEVAEPAEAMEAEASDEAPEAEDAPDSGEAESDEAGEPAASDAGNVADEAADGEDEAAAPAEAAAEAPAEEAEPAAEAPAEAEARPEYDFAMLHDMNVHQLQEVAAGVDHEAVHGYSTMHKEELLHALCLAFGLEEHVHHEIVGVDKIAVKAKINALKAERDEAFARGDKASVKRARRRIHNLKHRLRKATI